MNTGEQLKDFIDNSKSIVIVQADNPDGDSLASALALEQILHDMGKQPELYCAIDVPKHLRHLPGWDRVRSDVPKSFDGSIVVDCNSRSLMEVADKTGELAWLLAKPMVIIDHHDVTPTLDADINITDTAAVSTGEVIYNLALEHNWPLDVHAKNMISVSILSDSLGLMTDATTPQTIRIIAQLVEDGVNLPMLDEARRQTMKKSQELVRYKGQLLQRIEYSEDGSVATVTIPWGEIEQYSSQFNPSILVLDDMRLTEDTKIAIAFKKYPNNRTTAKIRCNYGFNIGKDLAEHFGGGGHPYASGFKVTNRPFEDVKQETIKVASELLDKLGEKNAAI